MIRSQRKVIITARDATERDEMRRGKSFQKVGEGRIGKGAMIERKTVSYAVKV